MSEKEEKSITRREFMADAAKGALVMGCLTIIGAEEAWARVVERVPIKPIKPLFTPENLNKFYQKNWSKPEYGRYMKEAKADLPRFLNQHFTLTSAQQKELLRLMTATKAKSKIANFINTIDKDTRRFKSSKVASGTPGMIAANAVEEGQTCSAGQHWSCWTISACGITISWCSCTSNT